MIHNEDYLREQANTARHVAIALAENIYKYIGNCITIDDLKLVVDALISEDLITQFKHQYILKDTYESMLSNMFIYDDESMQCANDDTESIHIIEEGE